MNDDGAVGGPSCVNEKGLLNEAAALPPPAVKENEVFSPMLPNIEPLAGAVDCVAAGWEAPKLKDVVAGAAGACEPPKLKMLEEAAGAVAGVLVAANKLAGGFESG